MKPLRVAVVSVVGPVVVLAGVVMLVTPGPGVAVILLGFTILATEFRWARYTLVKTKRRVILTTRGVRERVRARREARASDAAPGVPGAEAAAEDNAPGGA